MITSQSRTRRRTTAAAIALAVAAGPIAVSSAGASEAASSPQLVVKPGKVGPAKVGMTVKQAMKTGLFNKNVPNPPCGPIKLQPKGKLKRHFDVIVFKGRIFEMGAFGKLRTNKDIGRGSTLRQVRRAYGEDLSKPKEVGFGQWGVFVRKNKRWVGFLLGNAMVEDGKPKPSEKVTFMAVTKGKKPDLIRDGC